MKVLQWAKSHALLLLLLIVAAGLRIYKLDFQSLWIDEIFTLIQSNPSKSFGEIYEFLKLYDPHPPFYYYAIKIFMEIFGYTPFVARLFSVLAGVGGIATIYLLGRELFDKRVGLIASALLTVNWFHIVYSQEARMYTLLFLTTTLSFYFLVRFIKAPTVKHALLHAVFASLMIYSQFFALFGLFSQYVILLYFVIKPYGVSRLRFFLLCLGSGLLSLLLYLPALPILAKTSEHNATWIAPPTPESFTVVTKEFFGNNVVLGYLAFVLCVAYLVWLFARKISESDHTVAGLKKPYFSFLILTVWVSVTYAVPFLRSYLTTPMIVSRYFINVLPVFLLVLAATIGYLRNAWAQWAVVLLLGVFSIYNLIYENDYYNKVTKTQFREMTTAVKNKNQSNEKVVFFMHWLLPYYFQDVPNQRYEGMGLDEYVKNLRTRTKQDEGFWYLDGHSRPYSLNADDEQFLQQHYTLTDQLEYFDCWARHYEPKNGMHVEEPFGVAAFKPSKLDAGGNMMLFENALLKTTFRTFPEGAYELVVSGQSFPEKPIDGVNAHLLIKMNEKVLADYQLSPHPNAEPQRFAVNIEKDKPVRFVILYDNDFFKDGADRNAKISSIKLEKK